MIALVACHETHETARVTIPTSSASTSASATPASILATPHPDAPLVVGSNLVSPVDGHVISSLGAMEAYTFATHAGPHAYRVGDVIVDTWSGAKKTAAALASLEGDDVVRREIDGTVRWKSPLRGVHSVRPPDAIVARGRVIAVVDDTLYAFDDVSGARVWKAPGPADRIASDGALVFSTDCRVHTTPRWLVARNASDGKEVFRASLPAEFDPWVAIDPDRIVLVDDGRETSVVFDHKGNKLFDLHESILGDHTHAFAIHPTGHDLIVASTKHTTRYDSTGHAVWQLPALHETFVAGTDFIDLDGGDVLVGNWGAISDSGVWVTRMRPSTGAVVWETHVSRLGVAHSEYLHTAYIEARGPTIYVVSQAVGGAFFERLTLATGKSEFRKLL